jgi:hypothetical protein
MRKYYLILILFGASCSNESKEYRSVTTNPLLFTQTVYQLNAVVMHDNFTPPVANRNYTYANIAAYECIAAGYPDLFESLGGQLHGLEKLPAPKEREKIDFEFASVLAFCKVGVALTFSEDRLKDYVQNIKEKVSEKGMSNSVMNATENFAFEISDVILNWSKKDNYHQTRSFPKYSINQEPGRWVPTPPMYADAVEPW